MNPRCFAESAGSCALLRCERRHHTYAFAQVTRTKKTQTCLIKNNSPSPFHPVPVSSSSLNVQEQIRGGDGEENVCAAGRQGGRKAAHLTEFREHPENRPVDEAHRERDSYPVERTLLSDPECEG